MAKIEVCVPAANRLGEGPLWDVAEQRLYWVDGLAGEIWRCDAAGGDVRRWPLPCEIGSLALRAGGGAVAALATGLHFLDLDSGALTLIAHPEADLAGVRLNDGKVDAAGRFVCGSLDMALFDGPPRHGTPRGSLYRLDADLGLHRLAGGIGVANGPCWSVDTRTFYFTDSGTRTITAFGWGDDGVPVDPRPFVRCAPGEIPDGATVDAEGFVWSTMNGAFTGIGELRRYAPDGTLDRTITLPTSKPTSLMFGGPDLDILYITSMTMPGVASSPVDGHLLAIWGLGVRGLPEHRFAG